MAVDPVGVAKSCWVGVAHDRTCGPFGKQAGSDVDRSSEYPEDPASLTHQICFRSNAVTERSTSQDGAQIQGEGDLVARFSSCCQTPLLKSEIPRRHAAVLRKPSLLRPPSTKDQFRIVKSSSTARCSPLTPRSLLSTVSDRVWPCSVPERDLQ